MPNLVTRLVVFVCLFHTLAASAQITFEQLPGAAPQSQLIANLMPQAYGDMCTGDVNADGLVDVLVTGASPAFEPTTTLYLNTGSGLTAATEQPFVDLANSSNAFADVNGDGHPDAILMGFNLAFEPGTYVYLNDGSGQFALDTTAGIEPCAWGDLVVADMDLDNDVDIVICGYDLFGGIISKLYTNNGSGQFAEHTSTPFEAVWNAALAAQDLDSDSLPELLITGENAAGQPVAKLYTNGGSNAFTLEVGTPFAGVSNGAVAFALLDSNTTYDLLLAGTNSSGSAIAHIYTNTSGTFAQAADTVLVGASAPALGVADVDGNATLDLVLMGLEGGGQRNTRLYLNTGAATFEAATMQPDGEASDGALVLEDLDGDLDADLLLMGEGTANFGAPYALLQENDGTGKFQIVNSSPFAGYINSSIGTADVDGDLDVDAVISGELSDGTFRTQLYLNNGNGYFARDTSEAFDNLRFGTVNFADIDGDTDFDLLISGEDMGGTRTTSLYTNDGSGNFANVGSTPFEDVYDSAIGFADIDNDNDLDVLITGVNNNAAQRVAKLYTNDGNGTFSEVVGTPFTPVFNSELAFADVNGDSLIDVFLFGSVAIFPQSPIANLYLNAGNGTFTYSATPAVTPTTTGGISLADFDGDGDPDLLATGATASNNPTATLYTNDGTGAFTLQSGTPFEAVTASAVSASDFDGDQDLDLIISGYGSTKPTTNVYTNNGAGTFKRTTSSQLTGLWRGDVVAADIDGDGDMDLLAAGDDSLNIPHAFAYRNNSCPPVGQRQFFNLQDTSVTLQWDTVPGVVGYRVYYKPVGSPGWAVKIRHGQHGFLPIEGLAPATRYMWRVQCLCGPAGVGPLTTSAFFTTLASPCLIPDGLAAAPVGETRARLNWTKQPGTVRYRLRWRAQGAGSWNTLAKDSVRNRHWLTGLAAATTYEWQIKAVCNQGPSTGTHWSAIQTLQTAPAQKRSEAAITPAVANQLELHPNPTQGLLNLTFAAQESGVVSVYSVSGQQLQRKSFSNQKTLQLELQYPPGIYLVHVQCSQAVLVRTVVVQP